MLKLDPYLNFEGNTEEAFTFYKRIFGGEFIAIMRFGDMPGSEEMTVEDRNKIMHIALPIGETTLMGTDTLKSLGQKLTIGDNFSISLTLDDEKETHRLYDALTAGGDATMPLTPQPWSDLYGMCTDKFGIQWMLSYKK